MTSATSSVIPQRAAVFSVSVIYIYPLSIAQHPSSIFRVLVFADDGRQEESYQRRGEGHGHHNPQRNLDHRGQCHYKGVDGDQRDEGHDDTIEA